MTPQEEQYIANLNQQLENEQFKRMSAETNTMRMMSENQGAKDPNIMEFQLNLQEEITRFYHLLSGHILKIDDKGNEYWAEPEDDRLKILSDFGVKTIINLIHFYINKNNLLSNYDDEQVNWKVRDFGIELNDLVFCRYEHMFYYPTPEELFEKYAPIVKEQGIELSEYELYKRCLQWSKEEMQSKLRHYPILILAIVDAVHATYLRALNGEERESLRKQVQIHQSLNTPLNTPTLNQSKFSLNKPSSWLR